MTKSLEDLINYGTCPKCQQDLVYSSLVWEDSGVFRKAVTCETHGNLTVVYSLDYRDIVYWEGWD
jgi:hypothetical protein